MVDYAAVLRRTIDALPKNTPEVRERVYDRARQTVRAKLQMINPPPSQALVDKQFNALEVAIAEVETDFAIALEPDEPEAGPSADDLVDELFSAPASRDRPAQRPVPAKAAPAYQNPGLQNPRPDMRSGPGPMDPPGRPAAASPRQGTGLLDQLARAAPELPPVSRKPNPAPQAVTLPPAAFPTSPFPNAERAPLSRAPATLPPQMTPQVTPPIAPQVAPGGRLPGAAASPAQATDPFADVFDAPHRDDFDDLDRPMAPPIYARAPKPRRKTGFVLPAAIVLVLGAAGIALWTQREVFAGLLGGATETAPIAAADPAQGANPPAAPDQAQDQAPDQGQPPAQTAAAPDAPAAGPPKFTQRLAADGTESDAGPAEGGGEQSVAQLQPEAADGAAVVPPAPAADAAPAATPADGAAQAPAADAAIPVGQRAIFYEERTSNADGSARTGAVIWSEVRESPGNDRPPEPAVRGDLSIPDLGLTVTITIRRNADPTLPASHIAELVMGVPENFSGGAIDAVQRVNFKPTEESAGASLAAVPVKVAEGFFLVAMDGSSPQSIERNIGLLREQSWIDIPVVYRTGRRALFTMEKGLSGDLVFKRVIDAWAQSPLGN
jgi:hypothetical protein